MCLPVQTCCYVARRQQSLLIISCIYSLRCFMTLLKAACAVCVCASVCVFYICLFAFSCIQDCEIRSLLTSDKGFSCTFRKLDSSIKWSYNDKKNFFSMLLWFLPFLPSISFFLCVCVCPSICPSVCLPSSFSGCHFFSLPALFWVANALYCFLMVHQTWHWKRVRLQAWKWFVRNWKYSFLLYAVYFQS